MGRPFLQSPLFGDLSDLAEKIEKANRLLQNPLYNDTDYHTAMTKALREVRAELEDLRIERSLPTGTTPESRAAHSRDV